MRQRICLLPATTLRDYLIRIASSDLTVPARYGFALSLLLLLAMALLAPFIAEIWLPPVAVTLLA
ncbi:MAG: hypothetical protein MO846_12430 [Candidatus Devosia symbiotica]|nr:hypothetical protein [Candidatus Devosia symbiotica]